ncbi:MAG TPA: hypothetical protein VEW67_03775 [Thermoleophilaceae bacterium]|nr:hypothetical protein [Thermoleophilaceae bacterium]
MRKLVLLTLLSGLLAAPTTSLAQVDYGGTVRNVLPPGQGGTVPPSATSTDQIALYDGLTPLEGNVGPDALDRFFKSAAFGEPAGGTTIQPRGCDGAARQLGRATCQRADPSGRDVRRRLGYG